ncbi:MAG: DUF934 domain-containing protein [Alphaproteobacteria bacterium]
MWIDLKNGTTLDEISAVAKFVTDIDIDVVRNESYHFSKNDMVAIEFLTFRDGRGFSLAHLLRRDIGFVGRLVALGRVLPDQAQMLFRSGFDYADMGNKKIADWQAAIKNFSVFYQNAFR